MGGFNRGIRDWLPSLASFSAPNMHDLHPLNAPLAHRVSSVFVATAASLGATPRRVVTERWIKHLTDWEHRAGRDTQAAVKRLTPVR